MPIRRRVIVLGLTVLAVATLASPASAGGMPDPAPDWVGPTITVILLVVGAVLISIIAMGIVERRDRR
ncbi:MAG: hypothetical protein ACRDHC_06105 [Actinomycetota bacterium]